MRVGLLGGSFDPIHRGHVAAALAARRELGLERVLFLPTAMPPHKLTRRFAPEHARYAMAEMTLLEEPTLRVSTLELTPGQPAYTIETLERLRAESPYDDYVLLIGSDSLAAFDGWRRWQEILATTEIGVFARPGFGWNEIEPGFAPELGEAVGRARMTWLDSTTHPASSSEIRRCLAAGEPVPDGWLHSRVLAFAAKYELYRDRNR